MSRIAIKSEPCALSLARSPSLRPSQRLTTVQTSNVTFSLFNGGALDSQVTDSQYIKGLEHQHAPASDKTPPLADSDNSSDTSSKSQDSFQAECELYHNSHSQGDNGPQREVEDKFPVYNPNDYAPMDQDEAYPTAADVAARYANLKSEDIELSDTEVCVIAAIRTERQWVLEEFERKEKMYYQDMHDTYANTATYYNQSNHIAALESLLTYHRIPLPETPVEMD
ncbi:hypothetical protein C8J57DRAFT_1491401 [Mycena rebaudengoi]|nr:hypothetical protein C8J57DRAFT_1491401 [Mycena rebaudengoi]